MGTTSQVNRPSASTWYKDVKVTIGVAASGYYQVFGNAIFYNTFSSSYGFADQRYVPHLDDMMAKLVTKRPWDSFQPRNLGNVPLPF